MIKTITLCFALPLGLALVVADAQPVRSEQGNAYPPIGEIERVDPRFDALIPRDAVLEKDLTLTEGTTIEEMTFVIWGLVDGCFTLIEAGVPRAVLGLEDPYSRMFRGFNVMADGYGWRPLFVEWDWEETLANVRRNVFPEEAQQLHGEGQWYGDRG